MVSRFLLLGAVAMLLSACEPWRCDASTCVNGCCDSSGTCILNGGTSQCGRGGAACRTCETCEQGICGCKPGLEFVDGGCACTASSCSSGCCETFVQGTAECVQYSSQGSSRCGGRGAACKSCPSNSTCSKSNTGCTTPCGTYLDTCTSGSCCSAYSCRYDSTFGRNVCGF